MAQTFQLAKRTAVFCTTCGKLCVPSGCTTGYGTDADGKHHCFPCCGERDKKQMIETGRFVGYLVTHGHEDVGRGWTGPGWEVTNWPGSLRFPVAKFIRRDHNWYSVKQTYIWFLGPEGKLWIGRHVSGGWTDIIRCRRLKRKPNFS